MDDRHRKILRKSKSTLKRDMEPDRLLDHLNTILSDLDIEEIRQEGTREKKAEKLLDMLPRRGPHAFNAFKEALRKGNQSFLVDHLIENTDLADKSCSRCAKMGEDLNLIRSEKKKLKKDVLEMNNKIKEFTSEYRKQESQKVWQDLENLKRDLQESNGGVAKETEKQVQQITTLQKENQDLRNETIQKRCRISELNAQLRRKNEALKKTKEELEDEKQNGKKIKEKWEAVLKQKKKAMEEIGQLNKKLNKQDERYSHCENLKEELNLIKTEKENLEKEVGKLSKDYQRALETSLQKEPESCSRCEELKRTLNVITGERDSMRQQKQNLDKEVVNLNNRIKEISEDYQRTKKELQQILMLERENVSWELVAANEQRKEEKNVLQGKNEELEELKDQIKRRSFQLRKNTVQPTREKRHIEKKQKEGQPKQK